MRKRYIVLLLSALLAACNSSPATPAGDAANGEALFNQLVFDAAPGCSACHSVEPDEVLVGPSLAGVATHAAIRISGYNAADYLRESIIRPDAYIVSGFQAGYMYPDYSQDLSPEQIDDLLAYLLTLK